MQNITTNEHNENKSRWSISDKISFSMMAATFFLAIVSTFQTCESKEATKAIIGQDSAAQKQIIILDSQLSISRRTMIAQLRAYVYVDNFPDTSSYPFFKIFSVKNSGQTPAYNLYAWLRTEVKWLNETPVFDTTAPTNNGDSSKVTLNPGATMIYSTSFTPTKLQRTAIEKGTAKIFVWGRINYIDAFGNTRNTKWRYRSRKGGNPYLIELDSDGNQAD
jgi:hypothetical protein